MCFKNLPVEFDELGNARLKEGVADPYAYQVREVTPLDQDEQRLSELMARNGHIRRADFDPVAVIAVGINARWRAVIQDILPALIAARVRFTTEKVSVMLAHEERDIGDRIASRHRVIVLNRDGG